ncbi:MAG: M20 family metallopeptidase [Desulfitobacteriaceae bacterium]
MNTVKEFLREQAQCLHEEIWDVAKQIGEHPELGHKEYFAANLLSYFLLRHGFEVEHKIAGFDTAFIAKFTGTHPGPRIAFLAEYDALPDVGHGCGHNLIGAAGAAAAVLLSKCVQLPGEVLVIGTPAEETNGAKVILVEKGIFQGVDIAMMFHPGSQNVPQSDSLALDALEYTFHGRAAHSASSSYYGINALEAMINFFVDLNDLKKQIPEDSRIDGIITEGGIAPNIIPERAVARFYLRARKRIALDDLRKQVVQCAQNAAARVSARVTWQKYELSYDELRSNQTLAECFAKNLLKLGVTEIAAPHTVMGSMDMGNVSWIVPSIHPYLVLGTGNEIPHTRNFAEASLSLAGKRLLMLAMQSLAFTGWDVLTDKQLLQNIKNEFDRGLKL